MEQVIFNGAIVNREDVSIQMEDRGYQFGDGVYEVIRVYNSKLFTGDEHLKRLIESAEKIGMTIPYTIKELKEQIYQLIEKTEVKLGTIYLQFSRGVSPRNHLFPGPDVQPVFTAYTKSVDRPVDNMEKGVRTILVEDIRWLLCDIKSLNLLGNVLAKQKAFEAGCFEAIQHRGETVTEGSLSNVTIIKDGVVKTHPANHLILNGITRQKMLELCQNNGIPYEEKAFTVSELKEADEVFLTGTTVEIMPIVEVEGSPVKDGCLGPITKRLQTLFVEEIIRQCDSL